MGVQPSEPSLAKLWNAAARTCLSAFEAIPEGKQLRIWAGVKGPQHAYATLDEDLADDRSLDRAGSALVRLARALPLVRMRRHGVVEHLYVERVAGELYLSVRSLPEERAHVRMLVRARDVTDFAESRRHRGRPRTPWDASCRKRLVRTDPRGWACVIEPGAVWFVEWLERAGAKTIYSCEGHPDGFHVTFRGPYALAHRMARAPYADINIFRSGAFPQKGQWQLRLDRAPRDRTERDLFLRRLAEFLVSDDTPERA